LKFFPSPVVSPGRERNAVRSLTARLFTRAEQAQNHCQTGNMGLAFRVILDWMENLGTIEGPAHS
jgi:hypothetical protein